jgi:hypothetical protein
LTYFVKNLVLVRQLDILLEEVAFSVQPLSLPPVVECACDENFIGFGMFPKMRVSFRCNRTDGVAELTTWRYSFPWCGIARMEVGRGRGRGRDEDWWIREMSGRRRMIAKDDDDLVLSKVGWSLVDLGDGEHTDAGLIMSVESQQLANYYTGTAMGGKLRKGGDDWTKFVVLQEQVEGGSAGECKSRQSCLERARLVLVLVKKQRPQARTTSSPQTWYELARGFSLQPLFVIVPPSIPILLRLSIANWAFVRQGIQQNAILLGTSITNVIHVSCLSTF